PATPRALRARPRHVERRGAPCYLPSELTPSGVSAGVVTERVTLDDNRVALALYGERNANLKLVERATSPEVHARGNELTSALAVRALLEKQVKRVILARPAVEAGERLGFLPGSMEEKVSPYLRPLYDALHDMMDFEKADQLLARGLIEVAPIAFMRGRTLND